MRLYVAGILITAIASDSAARCESYSFAPEKIQIVLCVQSVKGDLLSFHFTDTTF